MLTVSNRLILTYLIPCHLLTTHTLPSPSLLRPYPRLLKLFTPLSTCIRRGDLSGFDAALAAGEDEMVKRRIYLTLERGRDIALRNLLRKVFLAGGFEEGKDGESIRRTRVPLEEFVAAVRLGSRGEVGRVESDEVECLLANMIYKVRENISLISSPIRFYLVAYSAQSRDRRTPRKILLPDLLPHQSTHIPPPPSQADPTAEPHEGLHFARKRLRRPQQKRRFPRHQRLDFKSTPPQNRPFLLPPTIDNTYENTHTYPFSGCLAVIFVLLLQPPPPKNRKKRFAFLGCFSMDHNLSLYFGKKRFVFFY